MKKNEYGLFTAIAMIVGIVIGSGIFFRSDDILKATGGSIALGVLVFIIGAIAIIFGSLTISELASRTSEAGGLIAYAEKSYNKSVACAFGWFQTFLYLPALVAVIGWVSGIYICILFGIEGKFEYQMLIGLLAICVMFITNALSAKFGGLFQSASTVIKLVPLFLIAIIGLFFGDLSAVSMSDITNMKSAGWIGAIAPIAFSFDGWTVATSIGHEIKDSKRNLPKALIIAPIIILVVYITYFVGISSLVGPQEVIALGDEHVYVAASKIFGDTGAKVLITFVVISILGGLNGLTLGLIRMPYSLGIRGMFPKSEAMCNVDEKTGISKNSAIVAFGLVLGWFAIHFIVTKMNILTGDVTEISVTISYVLYTLLYAKVFMMGRKGEIKGIFRGVINPIMAILGAAIIVLGSIMNPMFIVFALICSLVLIAAVVFWKKKEKSMV